MYKRNAIFYSLPIAYACGVTWALYSLHNTHGFWSFIFLCAMNFAVIATVQYAADHLQDPSLSQ
jgi:hypothetical protein